MSNHHMKGKRNAAKPESKARGAFIHMRVKQSDKDLMVRSLEPSEKLSEFLINLGLIEAKKRASVKYAEKFAAEVKSGVMR